MQKVGTQHNSKHRESRKPESIKQLQKINQRKKR